jgi:hypothetical protein
MHVNAAFEPYAVGWVLIALIALLTAVSPWTQYYWHFDNFPRGGEDFEFSFLCVLMGFCLLLILMQIGRQGVTLWFSLRRWLAVIFQRPDRLASIFSSHLIPADCAVSPPDPTPAVYDLPLRI